MRVLMTLIGIGAGCVVGFFAVHYFAFLGGVNLMGKPYSPARDSLVPGHMLLCGILLGIFGFAIGWSMTKRRGGGDSGRDSVAAAEKIALKTHQVILIIVAVILAVSIVIQLLKPAAERTQDRVLSTANAAAKECWDRWEGTDMEPNSRFCGYEDPVIEDRETRWVVDGIYRINRLKRMQTTVTIRKADLAVVDVEIQKSLRDFFRDLGEGRFSASDWGVTGTITPSLPTPGPDFDDDGDVDGDDFLIWQRWFADKPDAIYQWVEDGVSRFLTYVGGESRGPLADADLDGDTDGDDFLIWQAEFGSGSASAAVPEPASIGLLITALVGAVCLSRRH